VAVAERGGRGCGPAQLPRSTPEEQGVSSAAILAFLEAIEKSKHEFHSFMLVRHGHVIAEGWWSPYRAQAKHMLYSLSKSFTSTAVGFAVSEGKLKVNDPSLPFSRMICPPVSENLAALRVKHLLTMSVGHEKDSTPIITKEQNWVKSFLALPIVKPPGSAFLYNSGATYMLSAIVQKVSGQKVIDYLRPRLFEPLGIEGMTWETCPRGINTGGWGLSVQTESLAKFGQFYLQKGVWNGRQILPAAWIEEATTFKIQQPPPNDTDLEKAKLTSDWLQGYCYQFWRCRHNAFRGDGAFGQFDIVMPDQEAVVAITCETSDMQTELNLVWDFSCPPCPTIRCRPMGRRKSGSGTSWPRWPAFAGGKGRFAARRKISGKTFKTETNPKALQSVSLRFQGDRASFHLTTPRANTRPVRFGQMGGGRVQHARHVPPKITVGRLASVQNRRQRRVAGREHL
jgi:hypothetical protein